MERAQRPLEMKFLWDYMFQAFDTVCFSFCCHGYWSSLQRSRREGSFKYIKNGKEEQVIYKNGKRLDIRVQDGVTEVVFEYHTPSVPSPF